MKTLQGLLLVVGLVVFFALPCYTGEYTIFGPSRFERGTGKPVTESGTFTSPVTGADFTLKVRNGDNQGGNRVSSATVTLNGSPIAGPSDFNQQVGVLERKVSLKSANDFSVLLNSAPGSFLDLTVTGVDNTPPQISISSPQNGNTTEAEKITVTGTVKDETPLTLVVNGIQAVVSGESFVAKGVPLEVGYNMITATATDLGGNSTSSTITVIRKIYPPDVVGMTQANAQTAITGTNLAIGTITFAYSNTVPAGIVISQNPTATTPVVPGAAINLVISKGTATVTVQNVVGMTQSNAQAAITNNYLTVGTVTNTYSSTVPRGSVISQDPTAGSSAQQGTAVNLVISSGPPVYVTVPNVIGMTQANAEAALSAKGFQVSGVLTLPNNSIAAGSVVSEKPSANASVPQGTPVSLVISGGPAPVVVPPDPAAVAPPIDGTVATTVFERTAFLYTGDNPIQSGVAPGTIELKQAAVIRGQVSDQNGNPLSGVLITVLNHPEFGQTFTRADGAFDMAINGGGLLTVTYEKTGYLPVQRQVTAPWQDYAWLPAVALIPVDIQVTAINLAGASQTQVHQGSVVTDTDGTRQATLLFSPGTTAQMVMPDGSTQPAGSLSIRATEYTVGTNGPKAMPGHLPPASGYTYAVELSADEAIAAGAKQITFSQPVYVYVDNFIGFPVGGPVPSGYYDREKGQWIPSQNGRVINILNITGDLADIDTNGDGLADDATKLAALGITDVERQKLAALYQTPKQLWRVPVTHFSPWDCNWPYGPPLDAVAPKQPVPEIHPTSKPCEQGGSIIECQNQVLGERIGVTGTPFTLNYRSSRVPGHVAAYTVNIPISGASLPASLRRIQILIQVAGRQFSHSFPAAPNQSYAFTWDGKDAYGQTVQGKQPLTVRIGYVYGAVYLQPSDFTYSFGRFSNSRTGVTGSRAESEVTIWQVEKLSIGGFTFDARSQGLGGWDMDIHHVYDPVGKVLLLGDGSWRSADSQGTTKIITTVAGNGSQGYGGDGGPATSAPLLGPNGVAVGSDGSVYIADTANNRIRRVGPDGIITTVAGGGTYTSTWGDGSPATSAYLGHPQDVTVGPDGSIYISDNYSHRVRRVGLDGIITTVAGNGKYAYSGDGGPATSASLRYPESVTFGPDGSMYIADTGNNCIRRVGPDGIITTVAGHGWTDYYPHSVGYGGDGGPAIRAWLNGPRRVAVGPDGSVYIADYSNHRIRRIGPDGIITTIAGTWGWAYSGDGGPATSASINPTGMAVGPDGSIYIADYANHRIRRIGPNGIMTTIAGNGKSAYSGDGGPATNASLSYPDSIAVGPDGSIYITDSNRIRRVVSNLPDTSNNDMHIPSEDGSQLYIFNSSGKHLRTHNALTGATIYSFSYDSGGRLAAITDGAGNITTVERDSSGNPTAIVAPFGQRTSFTVDANGYLGSVTNPAGETTRMGYDDGGLMTTYTDPKGNIHNFAYDVSGLLVRDENPAGGYTALAGTSTSSSKQEVLTTALGRVSTYLTEYLSTGDERLTITTPAGAQSVTLTRTNGTVQTTMPDGTSSLVTPGIDPRFGSLVYIPATTTDRTPSGLIRSTSFTRTATLADPNNYLNLASQTDTLNINNRVYTKAYNASSRTYTLATPTGRSFSATIDILGHPVSLLSAAGLTPVNFSYDAQGSLASVSQGSLVTTYGYDALKRLSSVTNANGQSLGFAYDGADRVNKLTLPSGRNYQFTYDANGNRTSITMPNGAMHNLGYTVINQGSDYTPPSNLPYAWQYSLDQEWTSTILPGGRTVNAAYDSGGRPTGFVYPEATMSLLYSDRTDRVSSLTRTPAGGGTAQQIAYTYDGSLVTGRTFSGVANGQFSYTYDNNFFLKQINLVSGANTVTTPITRDADGLVTGYGPFAFTRSGPAGAVSQMTGTGLAIDVTYDSLGRVASRSHTVNSKNIYSVQFAYDSTGNIAQKTETVPGLPAAWEYQYDLDGQLVRAKKNGADEEIYTYDVNGNRTSYQHPGAWTFSAYYDNQDRITQFGGTSYQFNSDGQMTLRGSDTFQYSAQGELLQATAAGQSVTYVYDGMGRRVARTDSTGTSQYLYGDLNRPFQLTAMRDPGGVLTTFYYDDAGLLFAMDKGSMRYYIATDHLGTPRVVSDSAGNVIKIAEWDSFGRPTFDTNIDFTLPVGFASGLADVKTGLVRFGYRDYDPATGRWAAKDPIFFKGGQGNLFGYVQNNPVNWNDPTGEIATTVIGGVIGAVGGAVGTIAQGGSTNEVVMNMLIGGTVGALTGSGIPVIGTPVGAALLGSFGDLTGQLLTKKPCQDVNWSSVIGAGLGGGLGAKLGSVAPKLPGYNNSGKFVQAISEALPGLGTGAFGLAGVGIGKATGF